MLRTVYLQLYYFTFGVDDRPKWPASCQLGWAGHYSCRPLQLCEWLFVLWHLHQVITDARACRHRRHSLPRQRTHWPIGVRTPRLTVPLPVDWHVEQSPQHEAEICGHGSELRHTRCGAGKTSVAWTFGMLHAAVTVLLTVRRVSAVPATSLQSTVNCRLVNSALMCHLLEVRRHRSHPQRHSQMLVFTVQIIVSFSCWCHWHRYYPFMGTSEPQRNGSLCISTVIGKLEQRGGAWAGCGPAQFRPRCTKCNSPPINS